MKIQCPHCLGFATRPDPHRWFELPLALLLMQPYHCRRCAHRFLRLRWPDLPLLPFPRQSTLAR